MTPRALLTFAIDRDFDLVGLRQRTRRLAEVLGFDTQDQTRIATAISEIARDAAASGRLAGISFHWDETRGTLKMFVSIATTPSADQAATGDDHPSDGVNRARRLMDGFSVERRGDEHVTLLEKQLPRARPRPNPADVADAVAAIANVDADPLAEVRAQNKELLVGLSEVKEKQDELERLNQELESTNRGVVALYAELDEKSMALQSLNRTLEERVEHAMEEREKAQDALRQSQKMEAVGQLTGGIAHDFNNLLQTISGNLEIIGRHLPPGLPRIERALAHATRGARSAANLTQRLLAFSRRQSLDPRPVDAGRLVLGMTELFRRTLGETVEIHTRFAPDACLIEIDANELENALLNLGVNARDAMGEGGTLSVETKRVRLATQLDDFTTASLQAGDYVYICVRDTGMGMPADVRLRVFEPFFTTKPVGKGTGLGLSMVYGFAKQSGGDVAIESVEGGGTTVTLVFPQWQGDLNDATDDEVIERVQVRGDETILVVEDDEEVLAYSCTALEELGYRVLTAASGRAALAILGSSTPIDLLFSDVVLAGGMSGRELSEAAVAMRPELKVLFTSGYARDALEGRGRLDDGMELVGKPFSYANLATRVRSVLGAPRSWLPRKRSAN